MTSLYFRILEPPDPEVFEPGWVEIPATLNPFVLGRQLWRQPDVSRHPERCAAIEFDHRSELWVIKNRAVDRIVILNDGASKFELLNGMSVDLHPGRWLGSVARVFRFELVDRPPPGPIRVHDEPDLSKVCPTETTTVRPDVLRARKFLEKFPFKRRALAYQWRRHLEPTDDLSGDLTTAEVAKEFGEQAKAITSWRIELATAVFKEPRRQSEIREFVIKHRVMTRETLLEALRWLEGPGDGPSTRPPMPVPRPRPTDRRGPIVQGGGDQRTTRRPPRS